jgi:drug/metabolite transporter (DMT)-like permease
MMQSSLAIRLAPAAFAVLWSTGFIASKLVAPYAEPFTFLSVRFAIAMMLLLALGWLGGAALPKKRLILHAALAGILLQAFYLGGVFWAIHRGMPAGVNALIVNLQPILTALLAGLLLGERITLRDWTGLLLGLVGVGAVLAPKLGFAAAGIDAATITASLIALFGLAAGTLYHKRYATGIDLRYGAAIQFMGALAVTTPIAFMFETRVVVWSADLLAAMVWSVLVMSLGAISLLMLLIRANAVSKVAALFYLVPPLTQIIASWWFGETLLPIQIAGMALVVVAVLTAGWPSGRAKP